MSKHYNTNYTEVEINLVLKKIKDCIINNKYTISQNESRLENIQFINEYNITQVKQKELLLGIKTHDFCHTLKNQKQGYESEILYVFIPQVSLFDSDDMSVTIDVYIKFNLLQIASGDRIVVISFHKRNKPCSYVFR